MNEKTHRIIVFREGQLKSYTPHGNEDITLHVRIAKVDLNESTRAAGQSILDVLHTHINNRFSVVLSHIADDETTAPQHSTREPRNTDSSNNSAAVVGAPPQKSAELLRLIEISGWSRKLPPYQRFLYEFAHMIDPECKVDLSSFEEADQKQRTEMAAQLQYVYCRVKESLTEIEDKTESALRLKILDGAFESDKNNLDARVIFMKAEQADAEIF